MDGKQGQDPDTSQLFLVRLWTEGNAGMDEPDAPESGESGESQLHGKVMHVLSGKGSNFHDWSTLLGLLTRMMSPTNDKEDTATGQEGATT